MAEEKLNAELDNAKRRLEYARVKSRVLRTIAKTHRVEKAIARFRKKYPDAPPLWGEEK